MQQAGRTGKWQNWAPPPPKAHCALALFCIAVEEEGDDDDDKEEEEGDDENDNENLYENWTGPSPLSSQSTSKPVQLSKKKPFKISIQPPTL